VDAPGGVSYRAFPGSLTAFVALDVQRPPFSDPKLRRAVAAALDRSTLASLGNQTPTDHLLPPAVREAGASRYSPGALARARRLAGTNQVTVRMAVQSGDEASRRFADVVRTELAPLGIDVQPVIVADVGAAIRDPATGIQLAALQTELDYPDPASLLTRMLGTDVPAAWLPAATLAAVHRLARLNGEVRDRAAAALAVRLATRDVPVVPYGTPMIGAVLGPRLGCRVWNGVDSWLDIAALCLGTR
jgi:ABC-type transport system substrate-binding protein